MAGVGHVVEGEGFGVAVEAGENEALTVFENLLDQRTGIDLFRKEGDIEQDGFRRCEALHAGCLVMNELFLARSFAGVESQDAGADETSERGLGEGVAHGGEASGVVGGGEEKTKEGDGGKRSRPTFTRESEVGRAGILHRNAVLSAFENPPFKGVPEIYWLGRETGHRHPTGICWFAKSNALREHGRGCPTEVRHLHYSLRARGVKVCGDRRRSRSSRWPWNCRRGGRGRIELLELVAEGGGEFVVFGFNGAGELFLEAFEGRELAFAEHFLAPLLEEDEFLALVFDELADRIASRNWRMSSMP